MARTKEQIEQWIEANGGAAAIQATSNEKTVPNPVATDYNRDDYDPTEPRTITVEVITWKNPRTRASMTATRLPGEQYEDITTVPAATAETSVTRHPVEQHTDADGTTWTQWSDGDWTKQGPSGAEQRATRAEAAAEERRIEAEKEKAAAIDRQTKQQEEQNRLAQARLDADAASKAADDARADAIAARPSIVSAPPGQRRITSYNPATNSYEAVDNPSFDEAAYNRQAAKEKAQAERDRLSLMIEAGKLTEATAATQYKRWFDENVTLPLQRAQEARARAAELRAAQEAEDRRQQFAASYEKDRQTTAISAGNQAANAFNSNLQYQVGPKFGEQFSGALNSLRGGPAQEFTADAFTFKGPSIEAVARKATASALAGISPYAKAIAAGGQREPTVASYGAGTEPASIAPSAAPAPATPPDYAGLVNQYLTNNPYTPGGNGEEDQ